MLINIIQKCYTYCGINIEPEDRFCGSCKILIRNKTIPTVKIQVELSDSDTDEIEFTFRDSFIESAKLAKSLKQKQTTNSRNIKYEMRDQKEKQSVKNQAKTTMLPRSKFGMHSDSMMKRNIFL